MDSSDRAKIADFVQAQTETWSGYKPPSRLSAFINGCKAAYRVGRRMVSAVLYAFARELDKAKMEVPCGDCKGKGKKEDGHICWTCMGKGRAYLKVIRGSFADPVYQLADFVGMETGEDEPDIELHKTVDGKYFTPSMLKRVVPCGNCDGKGCPRCDGLGKLPMVETHGQIVYAQEISISAACDLLDEMDALEMEMELEPGEKLLKTILRRMVNERYV